MKLIALERITTKNADEDVLYDGRINPVKTFATDGVKIWGQRTFRIKESQLNKLRLEDCYFV